MCMKSLVIQNMRLVDWLDCERSNSLRVSWLHSQIPNISQACYRVTNLPFTRSLLSATFFLQSQFIFFFQMRFFLGQERGTSSAGIWPPLPSAIISRLCRAGRDCTSLLRSVAPLQRLCRSTGRHQSKTARCTPSDPPNSLPSGSARCPRSTKTSAYWGRSPADAYWEYTPPDCTKTQTVPNPPSFPCLIIITILSHSSLLTPSSPHPRTRSHLCPEQDIPYVSLEREVHEFYLAAAYLAQQLLEVGRWLAVLDLDVERPAQRREILGDVRERKKEPERQMRIASCLLRLLKGSTYESSASTGKAAGVSLGENGPERINSATSRYEGPFLPVLRMRLKCYQLIISATPSYLVTRRRLPVYYRTKIKSYELSASLQVEEETPQLQQFCIGTALDYLTLLEDVYDV